MNRYQSASHPGASRRTTVEVFKAAPPRLTWGQAQPSEGVKLTEDERATLPDKIFDNLARMLGSPMPRRRVLKMALVGIVGAALAEVRVKTAWAAQNCSCQGRTYDPDRECCTPAGVQPKHPVVNLSACPNRVAHPGNTCIPDNVHQNGCGPLGFLNVPDNLGRADFTQCCNNHDCCYATCNSGQATCDSNIRICMRFACMAAYSAGGSFLDQIKRNMCLNLAETYATGVAAAGGFVYDPSQRGACDCCPPGSGTNCECPTGQTECNMHCTDVITDPNNCGACGTSCEPTEICQGGVCKPTICGGLSTFGGTSLPVTDSQGNFLGCSCEGGPPSLTRASGCVTENNCVCCSCGCRPPAECDFCPGVEHPFCFG